MVTTNNSTGKRLLDKDIRAIFSCMSEAPQEGLDFSIIRIEEGTKLSPPSFELENGLVSFFEILLTYCIKRIVAHSLSFSFFLLEVRVTPFTEEQISQGPFNSVSKATL